jgi:ABC-type uncharacterized transport system involved in gliding motility auxiliary subunit
MRQHAVRFAATSSAAILLAAALTVMVNWVGARHWKRGDWTSTQIYSLSEKSERILAGLQEEIRVVVFMTPQSALYEQVRELLDRYAGASSKLKVEYIDPDREPLKTRQLAEQFGISLANTVVFSYGERSKYVTSDQMADYDYSGMQFGGAPNLKSFKGEEQFTAAILSLVAPRVPKVYFVTGHGEATPETTAGRERSLASLGEALRRENMTVAETSLLSGKVPDDADALAIIGPTKGFAEQEVTLLAAYLDRGGRLLVALDPLIDPAGSMRKTGLEPMLAAHGVEIQDDLVVDPSRRLSNSDLSVVYLDQFTSHPVTQGLEGVAVLFPVTRSVAPTNGQGFTSRRLVETTADGWGETDLGKLLRGEAVEKGATDVAGPVAVAVAVESGSVPGPDGEEGEESPKPEAKSAGNGMRMVVLGDSDFLVDGIVANLGNLTLALNSFNWLVKREEALGIPPRTVEQVSLYLNQRQLTMIFLITVVAMPGAAIVAGILVWRRRRH